MISYEAIKTIHIISSTILFGTGLGSAFYVWMAYRTKNIHTIAFAARTVVIADFLFITPTAIIQPITGVILMYQLGYPITMPWIVISLFLYVLVGVCWLPVVWIQMRLRDIAQQAIDANTPLPPLFHEYWKTWFVLGWPAFITMIIIFGLMVYKPLF